MSQQDRYGHYVCPCGEPHGAFPVYRCEEWQCRYVFPDKQCCCLRIGHDGEHATRGGRDGDTLLDQLSVLIQEYEDGAQVTAVTDQHHSTFCEERAALLREVLAVLVSGEAAYSHGHGNYHGHAIDRHGHTLACSALQFDAAFQPVIYPKACNCNRKASSGL